MSQKEEAPRESSDAEKPLDAPELSVEELESAGGGSATSSQGTNSVCQGPGVNTKLCTLIP